MQNEVGLWGCLLKAKYLRDGNIVKVGNSSFNNCSSTLRGFSFRAKLISKGLNWRVGDGNQILFWFDAWVPSFGALMTRATIPLQAFS